jgi:hypothetical protein
MTNRPGASNKRPKKTKKQKETRGPPRLLSLRSSPPPDENDPKFSKISTEEFIERLTPFAGEIGLVVVSWNSLHHELARLFWYLTGIEDGAIPLAIWNSQSSDRAQRKMLRDVADITFTDSMMFRKALMAEKRLNALALGHVRWLLGEVDQAAEHRNNFVHAPFELTLGRDDGGVDALSPITIQGNRRAMNLKDKADLVADLQSHRRQLVSLSRFTYILASRIRWPDSGPWPNRPILD